MSRTARLTASSSRASTSRRTAVRSTSRWSRTDRRRLRAGGQGAKHHPRLPPPRRLPVLRLPGHAHFYYVHLGKKTDDHANQIFIVNNAPREKIDQNQRGHSLDRGWHHVKVVRKVKDGTIEVYFDDMKKPVMTATTRPSPGARWASARSTTPPTGWMSRFTE